MSYEGIGYLLSLSVAFALVGCIMTTRQSSTVKLLLVLGLVLHVMGGSIRYYITFNYYGTGDAIGYFGFGVRQAEQFLRGNFSVLFDPEQWPRREFFGTMPVGLVSAVVMLLLGPSMIGGYVIFSLFSLLGLVVLGMRVKAYMPEIDAKLYLLLLLAWPSLWFWSSSLGKDCLILTGFCLMLSGYVGKRQRIDWLLLLTGIGIVFVIRPQVAALIATVLAFAHWLKFEGGWTPGKVVSGLVMLVLGAGVAWVGLSVAGIESVDAEGVQGYLEGKGRVGAGASGVTSADPSLQGVPVALVNILLRPFLWEAHNVMSLMAAVETATMWGIVWYRRRAVFHALRNWRQNRLLRFGLPFIFLYSTLLGMASYNLGITVRQRIFVFPLIFAFLAWNPGGGSAKKKARRRERQLVASA